MAWTQDKQQLVTSAQTFMSNLTAVINAQAGQVEKYTDGLYGPGGANEITDQDLIDGGITAYDANTLNLSMQSMSAILDIFRDGEDVGVIDDPAALILVRLGWGNNINRVRSS